MPYSAQGTQLLVGDGATPELFTSIAEVVSVSGPAMSNEAVVTTHLGSAAVERIAGGIETTGEVTFDLNFMADEATHDALADRTVDGASKNYLICWSNLAAHTRAITVVTAATDTLTFGAAHGLHTGQAIRFTTAGTLPAPLVVGVTYYVIYVDATNIKVATTNANAVAGTQIDITDAGAGAHNITYGSRYDFAAFVTGVSPSGAAGDKLAAAVTFQISAGTTINI